VLAGRSTVCVFSVARRDKCQNSCNGVTMTGSLDKLFSIAGSALCVAGPNISSEFLKLAGPLGGALVSLLTAKNGFYAFESALHVFSSESSSSEIGLTDWNASELWKEEYQGLADGSIFFAEDIFGGQFCARMDGVYGFDPETGMSQGLLWISRVGPPRYLMISMR
jgi:hypothetical protein